MRIGRISKLVAACLLVAGCGSGARETGATETGATETGATAPASEAGEAVAASASAAGAVATAATGKWPDAAPDFAPPYPGAVAEMTMSGASGEGASMIVGFTTADPPEKVIAFYRERAEAAGLDQVSSMDVQGMKIFSAGDEAGRVLSVQVGVEDGRTRGSVTAGTRPKG